MKRFLVERRFPRGFVIPATEEGRRACASIAAVNARQGVTWLHSYVSTDHKTVFCICDAPSPEAILAATERNGWSLERIAEVSVLDPHFYLPR